MVCNRKQKENISEPIIFFRTTVVNFSWGEYRIKHVRGTCWKQKNRTSIKPFERYRRSKFSFVSPTTRARARILFRKTTYNFGKPFPSKHWTQNVFKMILFHPTQNVKQISNSRFHEHIFLIYSIRLREKKL